MYNSHFEIREYYDFADAFDFINEQLELMEQQPLTRAEAEQFGVRDDMSFNGIQDVLRQAYRIKSNLKTA